MHVPFCRRRCPYCDFAVTVKAEIPHQEYTEALLGELRRRQSEVGTRQVGTLYFGGGTPSLLATECLEEIVEQIKSRFHLADELEVTLEANPNEVSDKRLRAWREGGINRLSIGCQSFQPRHLHALRRSHDAAEARRAVERALKVMDRVSIDLMFAGPSQPLKEWEADLEVLKELVVDHGLDHVSGYNLTIEPGTTFWIRRKQGIVSVPDDDMAAQMLARLVETTKEVGLERYEVSNFAAPAAESEHNSGYWRGRPYLGVGVGAHSLAVDADGTARRRANPRRFDDYMKRCEELATTERLAPQKHFAERLFLGARTRYGVALSALRDVFEKSLGSRRIEYVTEVCDDLVARGWMERDPSKIYRPTERGLNFSDSLAEWLFAAATDPVG